VSRSLAGDSASLETDIPTLDVGAHLCALNPFTHIQPLPHPYLVGGILLLRTVLSERINS
jgi:hypothetical protein